MPKKLKLKLVEGENDHLPTNLTLRRKIKTPAMAWAKKTGVSLSEIFEKFLEVKLIKAGMLEAEDFSDEP